MLLVKKHKISVHPTLPTDEPGEEAPTSEATEPFTHHLRSIATFGLTLLGILAVLLPPGVGASPVAGIEVTKPPWMFWWLFTLENWVGLSGILYGELVFFGLLAILPFVDRNPERFWRRRPIVMTGRSGGHALHHRPDRPPGNHAHHPASLDVAGVPAPADPACPPHLLDPDRY